PSSAPIWRRVQPWAYRSAARLTSTRATVASLSRSGFHSGRVCDQLRGGTDRVTWSSTCRNHGTIRRLMPAWTGSRGLAFLKEEKDIRAQCRPSLVLTLPHTDP